MSSIVSNEPLGLLAGAGRFPVAVAEHAGTLGIPLVCVAVRDAASPELQHLASTFYWSGLARVGRMIACFRRHRVRRWMMAGKVDHRVVIGRRWWFLRHWPDLRTLRWWYSRRKDNGDDSILMSIVKEFQKDGLECRSALDLCPNLLVREGVLTHRTPSASELADIHFGWQVARTMGALDIGQSVAVRQKAVLAVEAIEGTDAAIRRAGQLCPRGGFTVVKTAKPQQDMRFDVPAVGVNTILTLHEAGGAVLAIEAGKTILLDEADVIALANRLGIAIIARSTNSV